MQDLIGWIAGLLMIAGVIWATMTVSRSRPAGKRRGGLGLMAAALFGLGKVDRFAVDIELLHLAERHGCSIRERPVRLAMGERSTVRLARDTLRLLRDLWRIRHWSASGAYELALPLAHAGATTARR